MIMEKWSTGLVLQIHTTGVFFYPAPHPILIHPKMPSQVLFPYYVDFVVHSVVGKLCIIKCTSHLDALFFFFFLSFSFSSTALGALLAIAQFLPFQRDLADLSVGRSLYLYCIYSLPHKRLRVPAFRT